MLIQPSFRNGTDAYPRCHFDVLVVVLSGEY